RLHQGRGSDLLVISRENRVAFKRAADPVSSREAYTAVAGGPMLLRAGRNVAPAVTPVHPRSAVGLTADRRFLVVLTIDGRQPGFSEGATEAETGDWLARFGATEGLNLDGGGSSTLVIEGRDGRPEVVNRTIHDHTPGKQRVVANFLG